MPVVLYTQREFPEGQTFNTLDYCEENQRDLEHFRPEVAQVERFLEEIRLEAQGEAESELPNRLCSILVVPSPERYETDPRKTKTREIEDMAPDPSGTGRFCYYVIPKANTKRLMVDERWVHELVENWSELSGTPDAYVMAMHYWAGHLWRFGEGVVAFLFEGPVFVQSLCRTPYRVGA